MVDDALARSQAAGADAGRCHTLDFLASQATRRPSVLTHGAAQGRMIDTHGWKEAARADWLAVASLVLPLRMAIDC